MRCSTNNSSSFLLSSVFIFFSFTVCLFVSISVSEGFSLPLPLSRRSSTTIRTTGPLPTTSRISTRQFLANKSEQTEIADTTKKSSTNVGTSTSSTDNNNSLIDPQLVNDFCQFTNNFFSALVIPPIKSYTQIRPATSFSNSKADIVSKLTAPPEIPGIPRPVWLTILGSVPTGLIWYGYYKYSVEEELYQYELQNGDLVTGCGGYGTLLPFVFGILIGFPLQYFHIPGGETLVEAAGLWILLGQVNLYRRVNELCMEMKEELNITEPPLYGWWALLPPPLDVVVGLRQVHFLSECWRLKRQEEEYEQDLIAEELFPFISSERFTLREFVTEPKRWFWFTTTMDDFNF